MGINEQSFWTPRLMVKRAEKPAGIPSSSTAISTPTSIESSASIFSSPSSSGDLDKEATIGLSIGLTILFAAVVGVFIILWKKAMTRRQARLSAATTHFTVGEKPSPDVQEPRYQYVDIGSPQELGVQTPEAELEGEAVQLSVELPANVRSGGDERD